MTSFYELTNEAIANTTALLLGIPIPRALFLKSQGGQYVNIDIWGDFLLKNSAHAGDTRKITHNKVAREMTKIANEFPLHVMNQNYRIEMRLRCLQAKSN